MKQAELTIFFDDNEIAYEEDIYTQDCLEEMVEDDTISGGEYGFMIGYLSEEELQE
jgi:hypothetical protein